VRPIFSWLPRWTDGLVKDILQRLGPEGVESKLKHDDIVAGILMVRGGVDTGVVMIAHAVVVEGNIASVRSTWQSPV